MSATKFHDPENRITRYLSVYSFVETSRYMRVLVALSLGIFLGLETSWTIAGIAFVACVGGVALEFNLFRALRPKIETKLARVAIVTATFLSVTCFAAPIPMVLLDANSGLVFVVAMYACAGIVFHMVGYRGDNTLMIASTLPYVLMTIVSSAILTHFYLGIGENLAAFNALAIVPVSLYIGSLIYTTLRKSDLDLLDMVVQSEQQRVEAIAQRQRAESAQEKANAANDAKTQFLAAMSHEIRTPMNGVVGMVELLLGTKLTAAQAQYAQVIATSGDNLMVIINDILDFSKLEAQQMELHPAAMDIRTLAEDVATLVSEVARTKSVDVLVRVDPNVPQSVIGDAQRIRQVLHNLMGNAVKFTDEGYVVLSVTGQINATGLVALEFSISDSGIGISDNSIDQMFERFSQESSGLTREFGGIGLGLPICRELTELMGGEISVTSTLGEGSEFTMSLCLPEAHVRTESLAPLPADFRVSLLAATDLMAVVMAETLEGLNATTQTVSASEIGLLSLMTQIKRGDGPDLILLDTRLKQGLSAMAIEALENIPTAQRPPIIMLCDSSELAICAETSLSVTRPPRLRDLCRAMSLGLNTDTRVKAAHDPIGSSDEWPAPQQAIAS